jgi:hypothetical protein
MAMLKGVLRHEFHCLFLIGIIVVSGILGFALLTNGHSWGDDFASYIMQARSIVEGKTTEFVEENSFTIGKSTQDLGPVAYPWGTPILLAPLYAFVGLDIMALKFMNLAFFILFLLAIVFGFRNRIFSFSLVTLVMLIGLNPVMLEFNNEILSDMPFLFFSTTTLFVIGYVIVERREIVSAWFGYLLLGVLLTIAFFIRTNGILLVVVTLVTEIIMVVQRAIRNGRQNPEERTRAPGVETQLAGITPRILLFHALPYIVFIILSIGWYGVFPSGEGAYIQFLGSLSWELIRSNISYYISLPAGFFATTEISTLIYGISVPFFLTGMIRSVHRDFHISLYLLLTALLYLLWPSKQGLRFILPLFPFYIFFTILGLEWYIQALGGMQGRVMRLVTIGLLLLLSFFFLRKSVALSILNLSNNRGSTEGPFTKTAQEMFAFVKSDTPGEAVIIFFKPRAMKLITGRQSAQVNDPSSLAIGNYLCMYAGGDETEQISSADIDRLVEDSGLIIVFANPDFQLYQIKDIPLGGIPLDTGISSAF